LASGDRSRAGLDERGRVRHRAHDTRAAREPRLNRGHRNSRGDRDHERVGSDHAGDCVEHATENLRRDREHDDLRRGRHFVVGRRVDRVLLAQLAHPLFTRTRRRHTLRREVPSAQQPANHGLGHVSRADETDRFRDGHPARALYDLAMLTLAAFLLLLGQPHDFETEARDVAKAVIAGDYARATRNFNAEVMKGLPPEILKQVYEQQIAPNVGAFESAGDATSEKLGSVTVVTIPAKFEKGPVSIVVAFDAEGKVGGLFFRPGRAPEPAPTRFADYQTKTRLQLPFDDQWFVFWGGRTVQQNYHVIAKDQRFAYDILIMRDGKSHEGDDKVLANYY